MHGPVRLHLVGLVRLGVNLILAFRSPHRVRQLAITTATLGENDSPGGYNRPCLILGQATLCARVARISTSLYQMAFSIREARAWLTPVAAATSTASLRAANDSTVRAPGEVLPEAVAAAAYEFITGPLLREPYRIAKRLEAQVAE